MGLTFTFIGLCLAAALTIAAINRYRRPVFGPVKPTGTNQKLPPAPSTISVLTWNLGYGALGKEADFFADNGRSVRALSRAKITKSAQDIAQVLSTQNRDIICLQENASAGFLTRGVSLRDILDRVLTNLRSFYWADLKTVFVPHILRLDHGMSTYAGVADTGCDILELPQGCATYFGFVNKFYVAQRSRYPISGSDKAWVVFNIHLSAFDEDGIGRKAQLQHLIDTAKQEFEAGNFVIIGGDWNMRLCPTEFAHKTEAENLFWLVDLPHEDIPDGWQLAADPTLPTARTLHAPYEAGVSYTTIVDGFLASPNVRVASVETNNLEFEFTDHNPVAATFETRS